MLGSGLLSRPALLAGVVVTGRIRPGRIQLSPARVRVQAGRSALGTNTARPSTTCHGTTRHGTARSGTTCHGTTRHGTGRSGTGRPSTTRHGADRSGTGRPNASRHDTARQDMARLSCGR
jgi:hypothetical protein